MKIVFVCDTMGSGGAERVISTLSNEFVRLNHDVTIIMASHHLKESFYQLSDDVKLLPLLKEQNNRPRFFKRAKLLKTAIIAEQPDIVISFLSHICIYTWFALKNTKIPYVVSERNDPNQYSSLQKFLLKKTFKKATGCVFQTADALLWYGKSVSNKSTIIHNPVNLTYRPDAEISKRKKEIIAVGRLWEQKNYFFLIDAFKDFSTKHEEFVLKIYGDGPLKNEINECINQKGLQNKVLLCSKSTNWHKEEFDAKMFVLPSKYEGMPNSLEEALCLGIPSVSTNCPIGGPKELKNMFPNLLVLVDSQKAEDFAKGMEECLSIENNKSDIPNCLSVGFIVEKWLEFFRKVLNK